MNRSFMAACTVESNKPAIVRSLIAYSKLFVTPVAIGGSISFMTI